MAFGQALLIQEYTEHNITVLDTEPQFIKAHTLLKR